MTITAVVCGLAADSDRVLLGIVRQADNRLPAMRLQSRWYPCLSLHLLSLCSACGQARSALHAAAVGRIHTELGLGRTGLGRCRTFFFTQLDLHQSHSVKTPDCWVSTFCLLKARRGYGVYSLDYISLKVTRSKHGTTASLSLKCSNT